MKVSLRELRVIIRTCLCEAGGGGVAFKPQPFDAPSPDVASREQIGSLKQHDIDTEEEDELPPHLREPEVDEKDCWGPVPPTGELPYTQQDPLVRDSSPLPSSRIMR